MLMEGRPSGASRLSEASLGYADVSLHNCATRRNPVTYGDGSTAPLSRPVLLAPLEAALKATAYGVVLLAVALVVHRSTGA